MSKFEVGDRVVVVENNHSPSRVNIGRRGTVRSVVDSPEYEVAVRLVSCPHSRQTTLNFDADELELEGVYDALSVKSSEPMEELIEDYEAIRNALEVDTSDDVVNHPSHYADGWSNGAEVIDITEHLNFNRGNAVKYLSRAGKKGGPEKELEDLQKALWYVRREVERLGGEV